MGVCVDRLGPKRALAAGYVAAAAAALGMAAARIAGAHVLICMLACYAR